MATDTSIWRDVSQLGMASMCHSTTSMVPPSAARVVSGQGREHFVEMDGCIVVCELFGDMTVLGRLTVAQDHLVLGANELGIPCRYRFAFDELLGCEHVWQWHSSAA